MWNQLVRPAGATSSRNKPVSEMRAVYALSTADHVRVEDDARVYRVVDIKAASDADGRFTVGLRAPDGSSVTLIRAGRELVAVVPKPRGWTG